MHLTTHTASTALQASLTACLPCLAPWAGDVFRMVEAPRANVRDLLSGVGSAIRGQRWNPPGILTAYACLDETVAFMEWQAQRKKAGMTGKRHHPLTQVTIIASLQRVLDLRDPTTLATLGLTLPPFLAESHTNQKDGDPEILAQAFGRIAAGLKVEAVIVPSAVDQTRHNLVVYRSNLDTASSLDIHGKEYLPPPPP
jgi:RES domain-containing protein